MCALPNSSTINISVGDYILTPASCASLVNEVMKNLLYQRTQIPYPYAWLKSIVKKKRKSIEDGEEEKKTNFTLNKHYQTVSTAYDAVENIALNIVKCFTDLGNSLKEVIFVIGVTPVCPKEVFTVKASSLALGHVEGNHVMENSRRQSRILRNIFLEEVWMSLVENSLPCCNTYIFLKVEASQSNLSNVCNDNIFIPSKPLLVSNKIKQTVINFNSNSQVFSCCDKLEVFKDSCDVEGPGKCERNFNEKDKSSENGETWLQSTIVIRGFKDCFVNKVAASELW
nr:PREDICTED: uncharacterized protein LOC103313603 [Tribolium castaneum]|eukprot:XP_008195500.1 PREDICTED: uncharacterized protein LOC103313603 [Tribolium castaneum]